VADVNRYVCENWRPPSFWPQKCERQGKLKP
jgi:hypothetical protein